MNCPFSDIDCKDCRLLVKMFNDGGQEQFKCIFFWNNVLLVELRNAVENLHQISIVAKADKSKIKSLRSFIKNKLKRFRKSPVVNT